MKEPQKIIRRPLITEKSNMARAENKYFFEVGRDANKIEIKKAVEDIYKVKVDSVRTQVKVGKERRVGRSTGRTSDWKKAIVRLKEGEKMIEYFEAM